MQVKLGFNKRTPADNCDDVYIRTCKSMETVNVACQGVTLCKT